MADYSYTHTISDASEVTIEIKVNKEKLLSAKSKAYEILASKVKLKGFRPGKAPQNLVEANLGPDLLEKTLDRVIPEVASMILLELKLQPITQLEYKVTKFTPYEELEFEARFIILPKVELPNMSKISITKKSSDVTEEDIESVILKMKEDRKPPTKTELEQDKKEQDKDEDKTPEKVDSAKSQIDDAWVVSLKMDGVNTVEEFKKTIRELLSEQKKRLVEEEYEADLLKAVMAESKIKIPQKLIELELDARENAYRAKIERLGLQLDIFLKTQKTTLSDLRKQWTKDVEERLQADMIMVEIIKENQLKITEEEVEKELVGISDEKIRKEYDTREGRNRIADILVRRKAMDWLKAKVAGGK